MLGRDDGYLNAISEYFKHQTKIISYPDLITTDTSGKKVAFDEDGKKVPLITRERF
jgi:hypothetical protein